MLLLLGMFFLCLGWIAPGHYFPWVSFQQEWVAAVGGSLIGFSSLTAPGRCRVPWLAGLSFAVAVIPIVQLSLGQIHFVSDGVLASLYVAGLGLAMVSGNSLIRH